MVPKVHLKIIETGKICQLVELHHEQEMYTIAAENL